MADKVKKAHGHIIQADWNQTDPLKMDYIHNKPEIPSIDGLASENFVKTQIEKSGKKIVTRNCIATTETAALQINYWEPLDTDGTQTTYFGCAFPITIPDSFVGENIVVSVDKLLLDEVSVLSSNTTEYIALTESTEEYFTDFNDPRCLASNDGSGWTTKEITHNIQSSSAYIIFFFGTPIPAAELENYRYKYSDKISLTYSIRQFTEIGDDNTYDIVLHSNLETYYQHPVTQIAFQQFVMDYEKNIAQEWVVYFKAAQDNIFNDISTVTVQDFNGISNDIELFWIGVKPKCLVNKQYKAIFKFITNKFYGRVELLEELPINITENTDLNNMLIPGIYSYDKINSLTITNAPTGVSFNLNVEYLGNTVTSIDPLQESAIFQQTVKLLSPSTTIYKRKAIYTPDTQTTSFSGWTHALETTATSLPVSLGGTGSTSKQGAQKNLGIAQPNLLLNGDFKICQRTEGSWNTLGVYTVDRWRIWQNAVKSGLVSRNTGNGLSLKISANNASYTNFGILQVLDDRTVYRLQSRSVVASAKVKLASGSTANTMYIAFTDRAGNVIKRGNVVGVAANSSGVVLTVGMSISSGIVTKGLGVLIGFYKSVVNSEILVEYAKLEVGNTYTDFIPRDYAEELLACQEYFTWYNSFSENLLGFTVPDTKICEIDLYLPRPLRRRPTVTCVDEASLTELGKISVLSSFNFSLCTKYAITGITASTKSYGPSTKLILDVTTASNNNLGSSLCFLQQCPPLELDAEIY